MCGIVFVYGLHQYYYRRLIETMLFMDVKRGRDSTGIISVNNEGSARYVKDLDTPEKLLFSMEYDKMWHEFPEPCCLIGHNRAATRGHVTIPNAHPFLHGNIIGVHNGTLVQHLPGTKYGTDSEGLIAHINEHGIKDTWNKMNGAATVVYWDSDTHTLNFARNKERPLFYAFSDDKKNMFGASEEWMLDYISQSFNISLRNVEEVDVNTLHQISWDKKVVMKKRVLKPFLKAVVTNYNNKYPPSAANSNEKDLAAWLNGKEEEGCMICQQDLGDLKGCIQFGGPKLCHTCSDDLEAAGLFKWEYKFVFEGEKKHAVH